MATATSTTVPPSIVRNAGPPNGDSLSLLLAKGWSHQRPATIASVIGVWTGAPFALWIAVGGALFGALAGLLGFSVTGGIFGSLLNNAGTGALSALLGALLGLVAGLLLIPLYFARFPLQFAGAVVSGALASALVFWVIYRTEPFLMRLRGYRELSRRESALVDALLIETGYRMRMETVPAVWISDSTKPGAWAHMHGIVVTSGLLGDYDASESPPRADLDNPALSAILAHELYHWETGHVVGAAMVTASLWPFVVVINSLAWLRQRSEVLAIAIWLFLWPIWLTTRFVIVPLMARRSRAHEFAADLRAALLGDDYRLGLRRALDELSVWERPRTGWEDVLSATHPPMEERLQRLEAAPVNRAAAMPSNAHFLSQPAPAAQAPPAPDAKRTRARTPKSSGKPSRAKPDRH